MSVFKPKFALLAAALLLLPVLAIGACTGSEFAGLDDDGAAGDGNGGASGNGGSIVIPVGGSIGAGGATGKACEGPEDCDDGKPCTVDQCNADGTCDSAPLCGTEQCCDGDCAECCSHSDCDDGVSCTVNTCFKGQCMYVPADGACATTEYCSTKDGCRAKQVCGLKVDAIDECADESECTTDTCVDSFCKHDYCARGTLCCDETGCAEECCSDSQCNLDDDPCTVGSCIEGKCSLVPLCEGSLECCPRADGQTATCGNCCSAEDCNDSVGCTVDACGGGQCSHTPADEKCPDGYYCDPAREECQKAPVCASPADCQPSACQSNPRCEDGTCKFDGCSYGSKCCGDSCASCCGHAECDDQVACTIDLCGPSGCSHEPHDSLCPGQYCHAQYGCVGCLDNGDCEDDKPCTADACQMNSCTHTVEGCEAEQYCTVNGCDDCVYDSDCQGGGGPMLEAETVVGCQAMVCSGGSCIAKELECGQQVCCPPYGCADTCGIIIEDM